MSEPGASWRGPIGSAEPQVIGDVEQRRAQAFAPLPPMDCEKLVLGRLPKLASLAPVLLGPEGSKRSGVRGDPPPPAQARYSRPAGAALDCGRPPNGRKRARSPIRRASAGERSARARSTSHIASSGDRRARAHHHRTASTGATLCVPRWRNIRLRARRAWAVAAWVAPSLRLATRAVRVAVGGGIRRRGGQPWREEVGAPAARWIRNGHMPISGQFVKGGDGGPRVFVRPRTARAGAASRRLRRHRRAFPGRLRGPRIPDPQFCGLAFARLVVDGRVKSGDDDHSYMSIAIMILN